MPAPQIYNDLLALHIELGEWNGQRCEDCDGRSDDMFTCERCAANLLVAPSIG